MLTGRGQLRDALATLVDCGRDLGLPPEETAAWNSAAASLNEPLFVLLAGPAGGGKTSLAAALTRVPLEPPAPPAGAARLTIWKGGFDSADVPDGEVLECYRPLPALRGCEFGEMDPSAFGGDTADRAYAMADLVLLVFPAADPWGKSGWEFLRSLHRRRLRAAAAVLTGADGRTREELDAMLDYLAKTGAAAFGEEVPVFAVSSTEALAARAGEGVDGALLASSGIAGLEGWIAEAAGSRPGAVEKRGRAEAALRDAAARVGRALADAADEGDAETRCVAWIGAEIGRDHSGVCEEAAAAVAPASEGYREDLSRVRGRLARSLGPVGLPASLLFGGGWVRVALDRSARRLAERAQDGVRRALASAGDRLGGLHRRVAERAQGVFGERVAGDLAAAGAGIDFETRAEEMVRRAGVRMQEAAGDRETGVAVRSMMAGRRGVLWVFALLAGAAAAGAWLWLVRGDRFPGLLSAGALAVVALWGAVYLRGRRRAIMEHFDAESEASFGQVDRDLGRAYEPEIDAAYRGYADRLGRLQVRATELAAARSELRVRSAEAIRFAASLEGNSEL